MSSVIAYNITRAHNDEITYVLELNKDYLLDTTEWESLPWTKLDHFQCPNCPYTLDDLPHCPAARALQPVLTAINNAASSEVVSCVVRTEERTFSATVPYQKAIYSLLGLLLPTSGCEKFKFLRPMARFHLPFATLEETITRNGSMFLLQQYFLDDTKSLKEVMAALPNHFEELQQVNQALIKRIRSTMAEGDLHQNALIVLSSFAQVLSMDSNKGLSVIANLFKNKVDS